MIHNLKLSRPDLSMDLVKNFSMYSPTEKSLYAGGCPSDFKVNSLMGPYIFGGIVTPVKKHATEILGPSWLANTLWSTLLNLSFDIIYTT